MRMGCPALGLEPVGDDGGQGGAHARRGRASRGARLGGDGAARASPGVSHDGTFRSVRDFKGLRGRVREILRG
jgi:hypothetical protein